jgi:predicted Zn-dependent protease
MDAFPEDALDAMRLLGHLYMDHDRADNAFAILRALCLLAPHDRHAQLGLARAALRAGQPHVAERAIHRLKDAGDPSAVIHLLQGQTMAALGRHAEAELAFGDFLKARYGNDGARRGTPA